MNHRLPAKIILFLLEGPSRWWMLPIVMIVGSAVAVVGQSVHSGTIPAIGVGAAVIAFGWGLSRHAQYLHWKSVATRDHRGQCPRCGYDRRALPTQRCPECGCDAEAYLANIRRHTIAKDDHGS